MCFPDSQWTLWRGRCMECQLVSMFGALLLFVLASHAEALADINVQSGSSICANSSKGSHKPMIMVSSYPRVYVVDGFLTQKERGEVIQAATERGMSECSAQMRKTTSSQKKQQASSNKSCSTVDFPREFEFAGASQMLQNRLARAALQLEENAERLSVTRYIGGAGQGYQLHFDSSTRLGRLATCITFLSDIRKGGEVIFPWARVTDNRTWPEGVSGTGRPVTELDGATVEPDVGPMCSNTMDASLKIAPRAGRLILFSTHTPELQRYSYRAMYAVCPPQEVGDDNWVAQQFFRWYRPKEQNRIKDAVDAAGFGWDRPRFE